VVEHFRVFRYVGYFCIRTLMANRQTGASLNVLEKRTMLQLAITCLVIALIAAILGFGGIAGSFVGVAKILFVVFLVLAVLSYLGGGMRRGRLSG
jgi:uncharacterized membrane protein YtjA (UPF0391 family)